MYRRLVGKLIYLTVKRPDISYAISVVSQFMQKPQTPYWTAIIRILKYLKSTPKQGIFYKKGGNPLEVQCYVDSDWAGSTFDRRSTSGFCIAIGGNKIVWKSKKQMVVARSYAEAEYTAIAKATTELVWLKQLLGELGFPINVPMCLWCDNQVAVHIATRPVFHEHTKHIEIDRHYVREKVLDETICLKHISTKIHIANVLTMAVTKAWHADLCSKLSLVDYA